MRRRKKIASLILLTILWGVFNCVYINNLRENLISYQSGGFGLERQEYCFTDILTSSEDYIQQNFTLEHDFLESIRIRLALNFSGLQDEFLLKIRLSDEESTIVEEEVSSTEIENWQLFTLEVGKKLVAGKEYSLTITQIKGPTEEQTENYWISYVPFLAPGHVDENAQFYIQNGVEYEGEIETEYNYQIIDIQKVIKLLAVDFLTAVFFFYIFFCYTKFENIASVINTCAVYLFPLISFVCVELITENLGNISITHIVKNIIIYYSLFFVLLLVVDSRIVACFLGTFFAIAALVYHYVLDFRGRPFVLWDIFSWKTAATVVGTYKFEITGGILIAIWIWVLVLCVLIMGRKIVISMKTRVIILLICFGAINIFSIGGGFIRAFNAWDAEGSYRNNGLIYTFFTEIPYLVNEEPENYSIVRVGEIAETIQAETPTTGVVPENIIIVMNETFSDLSYYQELKASEDVLSYWNSIKTDVVRGWLSVPVFGGGTANTEYEVLTGNSMEFHASGTTPYLLSVQSEEMSLASALKEQGFYSVALHPNLASNWNRNNVYPYMGFDEFISSENWGESDILRWCETDESCYSKIIGLTESIEEETFLFCVTMQNHGGYANEWEGFTSTVKLNYEQEYPQAEQYMTLLQESDKAFKNLLDYYKNCDENTMIVMFGDHQAVIEDEFYEELLGKSLEDLTFEEKQKRYITPFMIWTNYDIEEKEDVFISSNYLGVYALSIANVQQPLYHHFLLDSMETIPVIGIGGVCDSTGRWYKFSDVPEEMQDLINEYQILQYNNVFDRENRDERLFQIRVQE